MIRPMFLATLVITTISGSLASKGYDGYGDGGGYKDYDDDYYGSSDSSSSDVALPARLPEGDYYICKPAGLFKSKRCLTYKEAPLNDDDDDDSSSSSDCGDGSSSSSSSHSDSDSYVEAAKYRYVYASNQFASKFSLTYPNATSTVFNLACKTCTTEFHLSSVRIVRRHLEFENVDHAQAGVLGHFQAWAIDSVTNTNTFYVQTTQKSLAKWWQVSSFRKRIGLGTSARRTKFQFFQTLGGAAVTAPAPAQAHAQVEQPST